MKKQHEIKHLKQIERLENLELIIWAFEHGYQQAKHDAKEGVYIELSELKKQFIDDLIQFINK